MKLREVKEKDYSLILKLDAAVYPVSVENKINNDILNCWYNSYRKYGMIYCNEDNEDDIVAMAINIPMPLNTWYSLIKGECFENTLNIQWSKNNDKINHEEKILKDVIGVHIYHIEVLNRKVVSHGFYKRVLQDLAHIANDYHHSINGLSGYCVTPSGNHLFGKIFQCKNIDDGLPSFFYNNNNEDKEDKEIENEKKIENNSEFIVINPISGKRKIVVRLYNTDISQTYIDTSVNPPENLTYFSKCNMFYTYRLNNNELNESIVWNYLKQ